MVSAGIQRASADEITQDYLDELNELRQELGQGGRVSSVSELTHDQRVLLELRLRKAGAAEAEEEEDQRPLDWAEWFAQTASSLESDLLRPFYTRSADEQRQRRDHYREWAEDLTPGGGKTDRSFLDGDDEEPAWGAPASKSVDAQPGGRAANHERGVKADSLGTASIEALSMDDAAFIRPLYQLLVFLLEQDGLIPVGSAHVVSPPADEQVPLSAFAGTAVPSDEIVPATRELPTDRIAIASWAATTGRSAPDASHTTVPSLDTPPGPSDRDEFAFDATDRSAVAPASVSAAGPPAYEPDLLAVLYPALVARLRKDALLPAAGEMRSRLPTTDDIRPRSSPNSAKRSVRGSSIMSAKPRAGEETNKEEASRPLDTAEWFAQSASRLAVDLMRPFYSYDEDEENEKRDKWRALWVDQFGSPHLRSYDRSFLEEEEVEASHSTRPVAAPTTVSPRETQARATPRLSARNTPSTARRTPEATLTSAGRESRRSALVSFTPSSPGRDTPAAPPHPAPHNPPTAGGAQPSAPDLLTPLPPGRDTPAAPPHPAPHNPPVLATPPRVDLAVLVDESDDVSLRLLSDRIYPLLVDDIRRDLMNSHQRQGFA
ncbi:hypothetical protein [Streptomyces sp. NPDC057910]|uniref:hypothetical protein n=1 Tax=Streptomyces sp. NPDC057910 TaxID=3346278 RepID=UPI0036E9B71E